MNYSSSSKYSLKYIKVFYIQGFYPLSSLTRTDLKDAKLTFVALKPRRMQSCSLHVPVLYTVWYFR